MDKITAYFSSIGLNFDLYWKAALILLLGTFLLGILSRLIFGKRSILHYAASSTFAILFIYAVTVVLKSLLTQFSALVTPLPFVTLSETTLSIFPLAGAHYTALCAELLSMIVLAFLVNLADGWLPKKKNIFSWVFFRFLTVVIGYLMHFVTVWLFITYLPQGIVTYAPVILLGLLTLLLMAGTVKLILGAILTSVNPVIGGLYTFFFVTAVGKQITRAVLTTVFLTGIVFGLETLGVTAISISSAALTAYIPILLLLVALWYVVTILF